MIKNLGYKILSTSLTIIIVILVIAYSPKAYTPLLTSTATLNFGSTLPGASSDLTMTITGASTGDAVALGIPSGSMPNTGGFMAWVSGSNTVTIRYFNTDIVNTLDPPSGTFKAIIIKQ